MAPATDPNTASCEVQDRSRGTDFALFCTSAAIERRFTQMFAATATFVAKIASRRSQPASAGKSRPRMILCTPMVAAIVLGGPIIITAHGGPPDLLPGTSFRFRVAIDRITGEDRSFIVTTTREAPIQSLACKCLSDGLNILYSFGAPFAGREGTIRVRTRFPARPATKWETWGLMSGKQTAYMPEGNVVGFIDEASRYPSMTLQATDPHFGRTLTAVFSISGIDEAVRRLDCYQNRPVTNLAGR